MPDTPAARFSRALAVYAEPLARGRRVLVVGDAISGVGELLVELGARMVHLYDPVPSRARSAAAGVVRGLTIRELPAGDFDVRDGAFELALVPDLAAAADPAALVVRLRRLVGTGAVLAAARNPAAPRRPGDASAAIEYAELYDLLSLQFSYVRMVAELPFEGVALAELGSDEEPAVSVDTQLAGNPGEPERFVAIASEDDVRLEGYSIVQLPALAPRVPAAEDSQAMLAEAQLKAELLEAQLDEQRTQSRRLGADAERVKKLEADLAAQTRRAEEAERRANEHQQRAERHLAEARQLAADLARARDDAARASAELDASLRDTGWAAKRVLELEEQLAVASGVEAALRFKLAELLQVPQIDADAVERLAARADRAEQMLARLEAELAAADEARAREVAQLEDKLRERGLAVADLEREVARRERLVRELLARMEEERGATTAGTPGAEGTAPSADDAPLRARLDALAVELARRDGELQARAWRISELEQQLSSPASGADAAQIAALEGELDVLRRALAQEHEARKAVESGDALRRAQSELARQATLIEQLSRELDRRQGAAS